MKLLRRWPYLILPMKRGQWVPVYAFEHGHLLRGLWRYLKDRLS